MNQIVKEQHINIDSLDQQVFFQSVFMAACKEGLLSKEQMEGIQLELIELLGKEVERYTGGESSSLPVEKAQELLHSITYCIGSYLKSLDDMDSILDSLTKERISVLFYRGMDTVNDLVQKAGNLLQKLKENILNINNYAYQDTITSGIGEFFQSYQVEFGAFDIPCSIDYPLCIPLQRLNGVDYIYEYLHRLTIEHNLLKHYSEEKVQRLLESFHPGSEHMLINLFEIVLFNSLGCKLLQLNPLELNITANERDWLYHNHKTCDITKLEKELALSLEELSLELELQDATKAYAKEVLPELARRFHHNLRTNTLDKLFISFVDEELSNTIIDEYVMEDEALKALIDDIKGIPKLSDKVVRIQEKVRSVTDFIDILDECFYGKEYEEVFRLINSNERAMIKRRILMEAGPEGNEDFIPDKEWQRILFQMDNE